MNTIGKIIGAIFASILMIPVTIFVLGGIGAISGMLVTLIWPGVVGAVMTIFPSVVQFWHLTTLWGIYVSPWIIARIKD